MRRLPNPWVAAPALALGLLAGLLGWFVTDLSCTTSDPIADITPCPGWSTMVAIVAFLVVTVSMAMVLILVFRSIAEWRDAQSRNEEPPGPGCEV